MLIYVFWNYFAWHLMFRSYNRLASTLFSYADYFAVYYCCWSVLMTNELIGFYCRWVTVASFRQEFLQTVRASSVSLAYFFSFICCWHLALIWDTYLYLMGRSVCESVHEPVGSNIRIYTIISWLRKLAGQIYYVKSFGYLCFMKNISKKY